MNNKKENLLTREYKIGNTTFIVKSLFSQNSKENAKDKVKKLIKREIDNKNKF